MDDYHEFGRDYAVEIDASRCHWYLKYLSNTHGGVGTSDFVIVGGASSSTSGGIMSDTSGRSNGAHSENTSSGISSTTIGNLD